MGHKANKKFFETKLPWSRRKDLILAYYLPPYLGKVASLRKPILLVDGFAGPGKFGDGAVGSPLIIAEQADEAIRRGASVRLLCVEADHDLHADLSANTRNRTYIERRHSQFNNVVPEIEAQTAQSTVFLYLDPYTVEGLEWAPLDSIFRHLDSSRTSIEVLVNFNAHSFARRARAVMTIDQPALDEESGDADQMDASGIQEVTVERLNAIVGGDWWRSIVSEKLDFVTEVQRITEGYCDRLRGRFREVYDHPIKAHWRHTVPKYSLIFGSRSNDATILMNDAVVKSRELWAEETAVEAKNVSPLFETRPTEVVPDIGQLRPLILSVATERMPRAELILRTIREHFGMYSETQIRREITELIKTQKLASESGRHRINDHEYVWPIYP